MSTTGVGEKSSRRLGSILRDDKGAALMMTMMIVLLLTIMAVGVLTVTGNALYMGRIRKAQAEAFNIAESGAEMGALWMRAQSYAPADLTPFVLFGGEVALGTGTYRVTVHPDTNNATVYLKTYRVVSVGTVGATTKTIEIVLRQATFGRFAYFTDKETSSISGGTIWWKANETCDGPAHSNNTSGTNFSINYNGSTNPIFLDILTGSGPSISYSPSRPRNEETFRRIFLDGSKGFKLGVPRIELPDSSEVQRNAAWGSASGFPSSTGVYLQSDSNGGLYINGDSEIDMSVDGAGSQVIVVTQTERVRIGGKWVYVDKTSTVTVNLAAGTSTLVDPDGNTTTGGLPNGVIYSTGNITSLKGEIADNTIAGDDIDIRSAWTIATDVNAGKDITITDNLTYRTRPDKTADPDDPDNLYAGTLGLVARDIAISSGAPRDLEIDAVCLAGGRNTTGGSFYVSNYDSKTPTGTLSVLGGIIQKARGPVGTFNSSTGQTTTGYAKNYSYDPRLAVYPPPFFPTTGTFERLSWRVLPN